MCKCKINVFDPCDPKKAPTDLKIDRLRLRPVSYYGTKYQLPRLFHARKMWETDIHTYRQTEVIPL